jgi:hypothetical protein
MVTNYQIYFLLELSFLFISLIILKNILPHALGNPLDFIAFAIVKNILNMHFDAID